MKSIAANSEKAEQVAELLKAVAHPLRIRIVALLSEGDEHVTSLAEKLNASQAVVSQQLQILRIRKLVKATREHGFARYSINEQQLREIVGCMESCKR